MLPYLYTLLANFSFALGSIIYTTYSRKLGDLWMNKFKAVVALFFFIASVFIVGQVHFPNFQVLSLLVLSGMLGLGVGDTFLLKSFVEIGPGRTLVLFGFQPIILGGLSYLFLGQTVSSGKIWGIVFCILCVLILSLEGRKQTGTWQIKGIIYSFLGMGLDGVGLVLTRVAFDTDPLVTSMNSNIYRILGAMVVYMMISKFSTSSPLVSGFRKLTINEKKWVFIGSLLGTFISLSFYLKAVQIGNLAAISAVSITGTIFTASFECISQKTLPNKYLVASVLSFLIGMFFVLQA